ncbi:MAG: helix-turn-helix domain-containing protein [Bdellovibrionales bacterium]|nr:helix-turn-helix domain-containing protein [Bdellovibrionales bacterium]
MYSPSTTGISGEQSLTHSLIQLPLGPNSIQSSQNQLFESGKSRFKQGDFSGSIPYLKKAKNHFIKEKNFPRYLDCYDMLFHASHELCQEEELEVMKTEFESVCKKYSIEKDPRTLVVMVFYSMDTQNRKEISRALERILNLALKRELEGQKSNNRIEEFIARLDIMYCLYAYVFYYYKNRQMDECRKELKNVRMLLEDYYQMEDQIREEKSRTDNAQDQKTLQELLWAHRKVVSFVEKIDIHIKYMGALIEQDYRQKEQLLLNTLEKARILHSDQLMGYMYIDMSENYIELNDLDQAATFLKLAEKYTDFTNFKRLGHRIREVKNLLNLRRQDKDNLKKNYDIIFDRKHRSIVEKQKGCISFKNQHILWDIMGLLASRPGTAFSKQQLVETVWRQDYMPLVHDNKIYVTFKRLRELVEHNSRRPVYIRRTKKGYHLNEGARILIK